MTGQLRTPGIATMAKQGRCDEEHQDARPEHMRPEEERKPAPEDDIAYGSPSASACTLLDIVCQADQKQNPRPEAVSRDQEQKPGQEEHTARVRLLPPVAAAIPSWRPVRPRGLYRWRVRPGRRGRGLSRVQPDRC